VQHVAGDSFFMLQPRFYIVYVWGRRRGPVAAMVNFFFFSFFRVSFFLVSCVTVLTYVFISFFLVRPFYLGWSFCVVMCKA
jgi:hypothetical protein